MNEQVYRRFKARLDPADPPRLPAREPDALTLRALHEGEERRQLYADDEAKDDRADDQLAEQEAAWGWVRRR